MDQLNVMIGQHLAVFGVILLAVVVLFLIMLVLFITTRSKMSALQKKYDFFTEGKEANIDEVLTATLNKLHEQVQRCLQNVKLVRYDAFDAMGGEMSYSMLLTDANNNGVLLTSIYGREESRCYAKDIANGKSGYPLAEEEQKLL